MYFINCTVSHVWLMQCLPHICNQSKIYISVNKNFYISYNFNWRLNLRCPGIYEFYILDMFHHCLCHFASPLIGPSIQSGVFGINLLNLFPKLPKLKLASTMPPSKFILYWNCRQQVTQFVNVWWYYDLGTIFMLGKGMQESIYEIYFLNFCSTGLILQQ